VPGPSAFAAFLSASGLPTHAFSFFGFPPNRTGPRRKLFLRLAERPETLVFYESPRRLVDALQDALECLGDRPCALGREMTKVHEEFLYGGLGEILAALRGRPKVLGEICWGVAGSPKAPEKPTQEALEQGAKEILALGVPVRTATRELSSRFGIPSKEAYELLLRLK
jgi:16S rRNA (cytidine1402-2'-O)-methyltransferase